MIKDLPQDFIKDMKNLLKSDSDAFFAQYEKPPYRGIRINTLKYSNLLAEEFFGNCIKKNPFSAFGYYLEPDFAGIGNLPLHHAGAFYVQEPSAMSAVTLLDVKKGDKVLDLCAAPGGKSTQIACELCGTGLLWSNEIIKSRANILLSNIERCGVKNAVVSCESPKRLCDALGGFFDKVLVDAPCSGEGMFRKDPLSVGEWSRNNVLLCKQRQLDILDCASKALRTGGELVYSTCTFSYEENEEVTEEFLKAHPEFSPVEPQCGFGRRTKNGGIRIFPMDGGEGHYAVKFIKNGGEISAFEPYDYKKNKNDGSVKEFKNKISHLQNEILVDSKDCDYKAVGDKILILPQNMPDIKGLNVLRAGVVLAEIKKNRLEPHHSFFMSLKPSQVKQNIDLSGSGDMVKAFLSGEELSVDDSLSGYILVSVDGVSLGFGKAALGRLKNKYPKGLRVR